MNYLDIFAENFSNRVKPFIEEHLENDYLGAPIYYYFDIGIKRKFRSGLPALFAKFEGFDEGAANIVGAFSELIFCAALVFDDYIDNDDLREAEKAAHRKFGVKRTLTSVLRGIQAGNLIAVDLFQTGLDHAVAERTHGLLTASCYDLIRSFGVDLEQKGKESSFDKLLTQAVLKTNTGSYALAAIGPIAEMNGIDSAAEKLLSYGESLGAAAQLRNDVFDFTLYNQWRKRNSDLSNDYDSFPIAVLRKRGLKQVDIKAMTAEELLPLFVESGAMEETCNKIEELANDAIGHIQSLSISDNSRKMLEWWAAQHGPPEIDRRGY